MKLADLKDGQTLTVRYGRAGEHAPNWGPWHDSKIFLRRRETPLPKRLHNRSNAPNVGDILTLTLDSWAEYGQGDYCGDGVFVVEDYYLEIKDLI